MQLILDADTDISVQTKMSTIQQEALHEKFNTGLIKNVCSDITDITNGNDECVEKQQIVVQVCEENVEAADQAAQNTETSQIPICNDKSNDKCEELRKCDKESAENKENCETENSHNIQIADSKEVEEIVNSEIAIKLDVPVEEKMEIEVNNSEKDSRAEKENKPDCELNKDELSNNVLVDKMDEQETEYTEFDKVNAQEDVNRSMVEYKIEGQVNRDIGDTVEEQVEVTYETEDKIEKQNQENIEMDVTIEEEGKINSIVAADKITKQVEVTHVIEDNSGIYNAENMEVDVTIEEQDKVDSSTTVDKVMERVKVTHDIGDKSDKQCEESILMDVTITEQDTVTCSVTDDKIKEHVKFDSEIENTIEEQVKVTSEKEGKTEQCNAETCKMDVKFEERNKIHAFVTNDKYEEGSGENSEMDVTFEKRDEAKNSAIEDEIKEEVKVRSEIKNTIEDQVKLTTNEIVDEIEQESTRNSENVVTFEEEDKVNACVTDDKIEEQNGEDSKMDITFEEQEQVSSNIREDKLKEEHKVDNKIENTIEDQVKVTTSETENDFKQENEKNENDLTVEEQEKANSSVIEDKIEDSEKSGAFEGVKDELEGPGNLYNSERENKSEVSNEIKDIDKLYIERSNSEDKIEEKQNEICAIIDKIEKEEKEESHVKDILEQGHNLKIEDKHSTETSVTKEIENLDEAERSTNNFKINQHNSDQQSPSVDSEKDGDKNKLEETTNIISHVLAQKSPKKIIIQDLEKNKNEIKIMSEDVENKTEVDDKKIIESVEQKLEIQDSNEEKISKTFKRNTESAVTQMDTDEVIDIADEKDEDGEMEPKNRDKIDTVGKTDSALKNDVQEIQSITLNEVESNKSAPEASDRKLIHSVMIQAPVQETNVEQSNLKQPITEIVEEKKKLTHISKLSNTLDILSDEEDDQPKEVPQKKIPASTAKECTSINIDDDDDIMLIDEESSPKDDKNKTESIPEPENEVTLTEETPVESKDKEEPLSEISENKKDTIQVEMAAPSIIETKTSEPKPELATQAEIPEPKKPLLKLNFLKTCKKNLADMTRDELEEFCILKIVESVVDRSNLSEIKSQFKAMAQNIEEYKKKASVLAKQNRDLQVVLKSVQEEQKKKSNMPITPLKITRSVGMQVLMTDKVGVRKKVQNPNTAKNNAAANSGPNRQGKTTQNTIRLQKMLPNTNNSTAIPVPRLVPAPNNSNLSNMKMQQPPPASTPGKSQVTGPVNKPLIQSVSNGLPVTPPVQKAEKRPLSRMQPNDSVTVDLTDDEPPLKVVSRNANPPVRLVPPQNLLAPNRQPFGQNVASSPRKVYIPISGSQAPVGVRPGQTIMLRTISPQGSRQRLPTPGLAKPNQSPNAVRMQRVPSRHPAPLPESVKQYQPQNWKALPPAPELKLSKVENGIVISWKIDGYKEENYEEIASYQLYAYQETTSPPSTALWKKIGDVKALALPMACTLTQFMAGYKYYFAVRAVDIRSRLGPFSLPGSILLLNKM